MILAIFSILDKSLYVPPASRTPCPEEAGYSSRNLGSGQAGGGGAWVTPVWFHAPKVLKKTSSNNGAVTLFQDESVVTSASAGRLDLYLTARLSGAPGSPEATPGAAMGASADVSVSSRSEAQRLIRAGFVRVDAQVVTRPSHGVSAGAVVQLRCPGLKERWAALASEELPLSILYADEDLSVVNKPAGCVVHPAHPGQTGTLVHGLRHLYPSLSTLGGPLRPGIVHRLDKGTSGLMLVARTDFAHRSLTAALAARTIERRYWALCYGLPTPRAARLDAPLGRDRRNRLKWAVTEGGRPAYTSYQVEESFAQGRFARLACTLETGRTHQIRVHLSHAGHAIVGDRLYSGPRCFASFSDEAQVRAQAVLAGLERPALHAFQLGFRHPRDGRFLRFEAPLPEDLRRLVAVLRGLTPSPHPGRD